MTRPLVGITASIEETTSGAWTHLSAFVPLAYVSAVEEAGGCALVVPPNEGAVEAVLDSLDGVLLSGGEDVDPTRYGADPHPRTLPDLPERDRFELELARAALARDIPVLAICRGAQVLNVARGGDLIQHLPDEVGHDDHGHAPGAFSDHEVRVEGGSRAAALLGARTAVKSHHHQALGRLGDGLAPVAWADDGTVEALEDPSRRFALGVLWHPEEGDDRSLFAALVDEARGYRNGK